YMVWGWLGDAANKVAVVVAHELAHQWFGNFVTMEWWTHLWLNEGFATWVSYLAVDQFFPEWNVWTQFLEESAIGFKLDALAGSHPIEVTENFVTLQCYDHICALWEFTDVYITFLVNLIPKNKYDMIGFTCIYLLGLGIHASQFMFYECFDVMMKNDMWFQLVCQSGVSIWIQNLSLTLLDFFILCFIIMQAMLGSGSMVFFAFSFFFDVMFHTTLTTIIIIELPEEIHLFCGLIYRLCLFWLCVNDILSGMLMLHSFLEVIPFLEGQWAWKIRCDQYAVEIGWKRAILGVEQDMLETIGLVEDADTKDIVRVRYDQMAEYTGDPEIAAIGMFLSVTGFLNDLSVWHVHLPF
ncbi:hypothetical protein ACJX0J_038588, partial [Zea mays]